MKLTDLSDPTTRHFRGGGFHVVETVAEYGVGGLEKMARGLSLRGLNIVRMSAERRDASSRVWRLTLHTDGDSTGFFAHPGPLPEAYPAANRPLFLWTHRIARRGDQVEVATEAPDALGLLGQVLGAMAMHGLFPSLVEATTVAGIARQRLMLTGLGGGRPSDETVGAVSRFLQRHTRPRGGRPD